MIIQNKYSFRTYRQAFALALFEKKPLDIIWLSINSLYIELDRQKHEFAGSEAREDW